MARSEARIGGPIAGRLNQKPHLLFPWADALVRHPRVLDAVEDVLGPDILCWGSQFFAKPAGDPGFVFDAHSTQNASVSFSAFSASAGSGGGRLEAAYVSVKRKQP